MNWTVSGGTATYSDGATVLFDDRGRHPNGSVTIAGTVQPLSITVSNSGLAYVFLRRRQHRRGYVVDEVGRRLVEINMAGNTYSGGTFLTAGVLQVTTRAVLSAARWSVGPLGVGPINISGGTLQDNGRGVFLANAVNITGAMTLTGVTLDPQGGTPNNVTITGTPLVTFGSAITINDPIVGDTLNVAMTGTDTLTLGSTANAFSAAQISGGTVYATAAVLPRRRLPWPTTPA